MDPGRAALINGSRSPSRRDYRDRNRDLDLTAPRRDGSHRISKPLHASGGREAPPGRRTRDDRGAGDYGGRRDRNGRDEKAEKAAPSSGQGYMTEEQLSEKFVSEEDQFVLRQSKKKADIRVRERRAKPIDFLAFHMRFVDADRDVFDDDEADVELDVPGPDVVLESVGDETGTNAKGEDALTELEADIQSFYTLERDEANRGYWQALLTLCRDRRTQRDAQRNSAAGGGGEVRLLGSVSADIDGILAPKTLVQLEALEKSIRLKLRSDDDTIDVDYWQQLLRRLQVWKARAVLKRTGDAVRARRVELLRARDPAKAEALETGGRVGGGGGDDVAGAGTDKARASGDDPATAADAASEPAPGTARFSAVSNEDFSQATKALYDREAARGVQENEEIFAAEEVVASAAQPKWADKHRPRKPRYFNRVQMGYEWNKYNQTHYDHDNPPPKVVQGYKFNIFYPELIDRTKAPTYRIIREGGRRRGESFAAAGEEDTCLIRFSAGPPYEDIAFRIVDREWDYSGKRERGFKSSFEKGILQLHFQFKKIYYRK